MKGMNATTGSLIDGINELRQSIQDILSTPIGSRVMRRNYGSRLMYLLDSPIDHNFVAEIQGAVTEALVAYETRIRLSRVLVSDVHDAHINLTLSGFYVPDSRAITLENIRVS